MHRHIEVIFCFSSAELLPSCQQLNCQYKCAVARNSTRCYCEDGFEVKEDGRNCKGKYDRWLFFFFLQRFSEQNFNEVSLSTCHVPHTVFILIFPWDLKVDTFPKTTDINITSMNLYQQFFNSCSNNVKHGKYEQWEVFWLTIKTLNLITLTF